MIALLLQIADLWIPWEAWFTDIEESHTSLAPLIVFRSPQPDRSWITAAGYDIVLLALARLTVAPYALWVSDGSMRSWRDGHERL